jgi:2-dehydro-3-deoxyphosphogluconate aldolase/(4S)-4-hydroxy-2-oxoglutarate aldolase
LQNVEDSEALAEALAEGGIPLAEVTFRAAGAEKVIARMRKSRPDMLIGAGTVITVDQAKTALDAGAEFIVAPGFNPKVVEYCVKSGVFVVPGVSTPSELGLALEYGLDTVKFFPAEQNGGIEGIKALSGPFGGVRFIPTGGINEKNLTSYLACQEVLACGGTFMVGGYLASREWEKISELCRKCVRLMHGFSIAHVGVNTPNEEEAVAVAKLFGALLNLPVNPGNSSIFVDTAIEVMKAPYLGAHGHIAIKTNSLPRAMAYLTQTGVALRMDTLKKNAKGAPSAVYLEQEVAGMAIHLLQA